MNTRRILKYDVDNAEILVFLLDSPPARDFAVAQKARPTHVNDSPGENPSVKGWWAVKDAHDWAMMSEDLHSMGITVPDKV